jgi:hypothetical protein
LGYGLDDRRFKPRQGLGFSLHYRVQRGSGAHPASYRMEAFNRLHKSYRMEVLRYSYYTFNVKKKKKKKKKKKQMLTLSLQDSYQQ